MPNKKYFDILINGGGMIGASLVKALEGSGLSLAIIDPQLNSLPKLPANKPNIRVSAINLANINWLTQLGIWSSLKKERVTPFKKLSCAEVNGHSLEFKHSDIEQASLGAFVENSHLQQVALSVIQCTKIAAKITAVNTLDIGHLITLDNHDQIECKMIIGADGANSFIRDTLGFSLETFEYKQSCLSSIIQFKQPNKQNKEGTWQQFRPQGPIAFLPLFDNFASLVVYDSVEANKRALNLDRSQLTLYLQRNFGELIEDFDLIDAAQFPLIRRRVKQPYQNGCLLVGDAAHTIHPLAGQGANLGFRDIKLAAQFILANTDQFNDELIWLRYNQQRNKDVLATMTAMDCCYAAFSNNNPLLKFARNSGLALANISGELKNKALKYAIGLEEI